MTSRSPVERATTEPSAPILVLYNLNVALSKFSTQYVHVHLKMLKKINALVYGYLNYYIKIKQIFR